MLLSGTNTNVIFIIRIVFVQLLSYSLFLLSNSLIYFYIFVISVKSNWICWLMMMWCDQSNVYILTLTIIPLLITKQLYSWSLQQCRDNCFHSFIIKLYKTTFVFGNLMSTLHCNGKQYIESKKNFQNIDLILGRPTLTHTHTQSLLSFVFSLSIRQWLSYLRIAFFNK